MKRLVALLVSVTLVGGLFAGCGQAKPENDAKTTTGTTTTGQKKETTAPQAKPVTLRFSHPASADNEKKFCNDLKAKVEKKYPEITLEFLNIPGGELLKKISIMLAAGDVPDLVAVQEIGDFVKMDALEPVDGIAANNPELSLDKFDKGVIDYYTIDGKPYVFPMSRMGYALLANKDLVEKAGFKLEDLKTWDDLKKVSDAVTKIAGASYGFATDQARFTFRDFYITALSNGVTYDKLTAPENKEKLTQIFDYYVSMKDNFPKNWASLGWTDLHRYIIDNKIAFVGTGSYIGGYAFGLKKEALKYLKPIPYPKGPSASESTSYVAGFGYAMFKNGKNKEESVKVLKECFSDDLVAPFVASMHTPAVKSVSQDAVKKEIQAAFGEFADDKMDEVSRWGKILSGKVASQPAVLGQTEIEKGYQEVFVQLISGKIDSKQATDLLIEKVAGVEAQYKK